MDTHNNSDNTKKKILEMSDIEVCLNLQGTQQPNTTADVYLPLKSGGPVQNFSTHLKRVADLGDRVLHALQG